MRRALPLLALALVAAGGTTQPAPTYTVGGIVTVVKEGGARTHSGDVWVYLDGPTAAKLVNRKITQHDLRFDPAVTVVVKGTTIDFPNDDKIAHNVWSPEPSYFDLGKYKSGTSKSHVFDTVGEFAIYCNIHQDMVATVKVVPNGHYARTDADGRFSLAGVPAGTYTIHAWLPNSQEATQTITVDAAKGCESPILLELPASRKPKSHSRKDHSPYPRYP